MTASCGNASTAASTPSDIRQGDPDPKMGCAKVETGPDPVTTRQQVLRDAENAVSHDRNTIYGAPEDSFGTIARHWTALFGWKVEPYQVALALALLKVARLQGNPEHMDSWVDLAGYAACGAETVR